MKRSRAIIAFVALCALALSLPLHAAKAPEKNSPKKKLVVYNAQTQQAMRLLRDYIKINTTNPPGNEEPAANYLKGILDKAGIESAVYVSTPGRANLIARLAAKTTPQEPPLLFLHHMDVVPADPSEWSVPPFSGAEKDGYIWGRGALDTKLTGVLHLMTFIRLKKADLPLNRDIYFMAVADEETGGRWGAQWMLDKFWGQIKPGFVIDEGGFGFSGVFTEGKKTVYACAVEEKKVLGLQVTARGHAGHASMPNGGNPIDILRRALFRMEKVMEKSRGALPQSTLDMEAKLGTLKPSALTDGLKRNTLAVTSFVSYAGDSAAPKENVIPSSATAMVDCRLLPSVNEFDLLKNFKDEINDDRVTVAIVRRTQEEPMAWDYNTPLWFALQKAIRKNDPGAVLVPLLYPAATDSRFFRAKGVASYGLAPVVLTEEEFRRIHSPDERAPIRRLEKGLRIMYDWVKIFCTEKRDVPHR